MTTSANIKIDKDVKSIYDSKIEKCGFKSCNDVTTYLIESYVNYFNGYKVDEEAIALFQYAPRQLVGAGYTFGSGFYIGEFNSDWVDKVKELVTETDFKSIANLARNMIYAFILIREEDTLKLKEAIENYRLRRSRFPVQAKIQLVLNKTEVLQLQKMYGGDMKETVLFRSLVRLLIQYRKGEACTEYDEKVYKMFVAGHMVDTVYRNDAYKRVSLTIKKQEERNDIAHLMFDHNLRSSGYLMRRIAYVLLHIRDIDCIPEVKPAEDTYEDYLFYDMAKRDYSYQNYRR